MLHGGIRYLENLDFKLVKEALEEKNLWIDIAPDFAEEKMFLMPVYNDSIRSLPEIWSGVFLYDLLSKFKNSPSRFFTKKHIIKNYPNLKHNGLRGGGLYADAIINDKQLTKAIIKDALKNKKVDAIENCKVIHFTPHKNGYNVKMNYQNKAIEVFTEELIIATGPFTDKFLSKIDWINWKNCLLPSKGSHLWISSSKLNLSTPIVLTPNDGRVIFIIPHGEKTLVGTTEVETEEDYFDLSPSPEEIAYLLKNLNEYFPRSKLVESDIISSFSGIRPLVKEDSNDKSSTSREHKIFQIRNNLSVIVGGKYTTFRVMGQNITRNILLKNNLTYNCDLTKQILKT